MLIALSPPKCSSTHSSTPWATTPSKGLGSFSSNCTAKALPGYLFFLPRLFVLSRVLFSKGYSDLFSHLDRHCFSWMLSRVSITITCSAYGSSAPTLVENTVVLNAWCLVNVLMHIIMSGKKCDRQRSRAVGGSKCHGPQQAQAHNRFDLRCSVLSFYSQHRSIEYVMSR